MRNLIETAFKKPIKTVGTGIGVAGLAYGTVACGGADTSSSTPDDIKSPTASVLQIESPTPDPRITPVPTEAPTPEATPFQPKALSDAKFVPTSIDSLTESFNKAIDAHPEFTSVTPEGHQPVTKEGMRNNVDRCENGVPGDTTPTWIIKLNQCSALVYTSSIVYKQLGYEEFYQVAVDAANYFNTELPEKKELFDNSIQTFAHETSPQ